MRYGNFHSFDSKNQSFHWKNLLTLIKTWPSLKELVDILALNYVEIFEAINFLIDFFFFLCFVVKCVDCSGNDWTSRIGYCSYYLKTNSGNGCLEARTTWKILATWASSSQNVFWSEWGMGQVVVQLFDSLVFVSASLLLFLRNQ